MKCFKELNPKEKKIFDRYLGFSKFKGMLAIEKCESPIEKILAIEIEGMIDISNFNNTTSLFDKKDDPYFLRMETQQTVECGDKKYRADILIKCITISSKKEYFFIIECDGYDFHERTKQQVKRDNERNRKLLEHGYTVIHFSGSEIYNNSFNCVSEIGNIITSKIKE